MAAHISRSIRSYIRPRPLVKPLYFLTSLPQPVQQQFRRFSSESTRNDFKDNNKKKLDEDYFYRCTTLRVVHNEESVLQQRYLKFNIPALKKAVVDAVEGATFIIKFEKHSESGYNKVIYLTTDNGKEIMARLAYPKLTGNIEQTIESEVATMEFIRSRMGVPVPRVLGWCSKHEDTEVNAAYILTERIKGKTAYEVWNFISMETKCKIVREVVEIHRKMLAVEFRAYGSIYRRGAVKGDHVPIDDEYDIGPGVSFPLTDEGRHDIDVFRGPWTSADEYVRSVIDVEKKWIKEHADPATSRGPKHKLPYFQSQSACLDLLDKVSVVISKTTFHNVPRLTKPVLWHPNFGPADIMISDDADKGKSTQLVSLIDWRNSIVGPLYLEASTPGLFTDVKQFQPRHINECDMIKRYYNICVNDYKDLNIYGYVIKMNVFKIMQKIFNSCFGLWGHNFMTVRKALVELEAVWDQCQYRKESPEPFPFPISEDDKKRYQKEYEDWNNTIDSHMHLCDEIGLDSRGWARAHDFAFTYFLYLAKKAEWIRDGKPESEWPFEGPSKSDEFLVELEKEVMENMKMSAGERSDHPVL